MLVDDILIIIFRNLCISLRNLTCCCKNYLSVKKCITTDFSISANNFHVMLLCKNGACHTSVWDKLTNSGGTFNLKWMHRNCSQCNWANILIRHFTVCIEEGNKWQHDVNNKQAVHQVVWILGGSFFRGNLTTPLRGRFIYHVTGIKLSTALAENKSFVETSMFTWQCREQSLNGNIPFPWKQHTPAPYILSIKSTGRNVLTTGNLSVPHIFIQDDSVIVSLILREDRVNYD